MLQTVNVHRTQSIRSNSNKYTFHADVDEHLQYTSINCTPLSDQRQQTFIKYYVDRSTLFAYTGIYSASTSITTTSLITGFHTKKKHEANKSTSGEHIK